MKRIAIVCLILLQAGCAARAVRCEGSLRPINVVGVAHEALKPPGARAR